MSGPAGTAEHLEVLLEESRGWGFLGPGPLGPQIEHARGFAATLARAPESFLDLGAGGGLPGLVLAECWPEARGVLLDAMTRRADFLRSACARLGIEERMTVVAERAETAARTGLREGFAVVTARSFGPPAVTAECAVAFLRPGGRLVVSEPPEDDPTRWPADGLAVLGMTRVRSASPESRFIVLERTGPLDDRLPRRSGVPAKRPLWS